MKFTTLVAIALSSTAYGVLCHTPPACVLSCVNENARWFPRKHLDIDAFATNTVLMESCLAAQCEGAVLGVAQEFLKNTLEGFRSGPDNGQGDEGQDDDTDDDGDEEEPVKHKPPKYGHRKPSPVTVAPVIN